MTGDDGQAADQGAAATDVSDDAGAAKAPSGSGAASGPTLMGDNANDDLTEGGGPLEAQLKAANDLVDSLTTDMNALRQQYETQDSMVPGYVIQQQLDETNLRLVQAQARQARIQAKMEKKGIAVKKDPGVVDR